MRPAETLAVHIWKLNTEGVTPDAVSISAGASAVLVIVLLIFNLSARAIGNHLYQKAPAISEVEKKWKIITFLQKRTS